MKNQRNIIIIAVSIFVIILIFAALTVFLSSRPKGKVNITVTPKDTTYTIGTSKYTGDKLVGLTVGSHTIIFKRQYFVTKKIDVVVKKDEEQKLAVVLSVDPNAKYDINKLSQEDKYVLEAAASLDFDQKVEKAVDQNPLIKLLPYISNDFRVDYGFDQKDKFKAIYDITLFLKTSGKTEAVLKTEATDWFKSKGYDLSTLQSRWYLE